MAAHKTVGHICEFCKKPGHTEAQCWSAHPELVPDALLKKRQQAMTATVRKRTKASDYASPNYHFQGMALTYRRPHPAMMQRRSTRTTTPTEAARQSTYRRNNQRDAFISRRLPLLLYLSQILTHPIHCHLLRRQLSAPPAFRVTSTPSRVVCRNRFLTDCQHRAWSRGRQICGSLQRLCFLKHLWETAST